MKVLSLPIKKKFFYQIIAGKKKSEFREKKPFFESRLKNIDYLKLHFYRKENILVKVNKIIIIDNLGQFENIKTNEVFEIKLDITDLIHNT